MTVEMILEVKDEIMGMMDRSGNVATISLSGDAVVGTLVDGHTSFRIETLRHQGTEHHTEIDQIGMIRWTTEDTVDRVEVATVAGLATANRTANRVRRGEQALDEAA